MSNLHNRVKQLEGNRPDPALPLWAELDQDGAILRYENGDRVRARPEDIPQGVKVYREWSPDNWRVTDE